MQNKPYLRLAAGTDTAQGGVYDGSSTSAFIATGVVDAEGNAYFKAQTGAAKGGGGGGGGGESDVIPLWKLDIPRDVQIAKWGLATMLTAFAIVFMFFIGEFKDVRKDVASLQSALAAQAATGAAIERTVGRIEDKLDRINDNAQTGPRAEPDARVPSSTAGATSKR